MKLGFDIDEVVCSLAEALSTYVKDTYDIDWVISDRNQYKLLGADYTEDLGLNEEVGRDVWDKAFDPEFQLKAPPIKEAAESIRRYRKQGHSIHFITSRPSGKDELIQWLRKNKIPFDTVHINTNTGDWEKGKFGRILNLDMYVDDIEAHLDSMWKFKKRWRKGLLLFDRPWNQGHHDASRFTRVYNWAEIDRHLGIQNR